MKEVNYFKPTMQEIIYRGNCDGANVCMQSNYRDKIGFWFFIQEKNAHTDHYDICIWRLKSLKNETL